MINPSAFRVLLGLAVLVAAGCGDSTPTTNIDRGGGEAPAACPVDDPTCYETGTEDSGG